MKRTPCEDKHQFGNILHNSDRSDSMWGTDYIAILFFLDQKVSRTTIENLRWQLGGEIIQVTFGIINIIGPTT